MPDEAKPNATPTVPGPTITETVETRNVGDGVDSMRRTTRVDLPSTPEGRLARVWLNVGGFGTVMLVFLCLTGFMLYFFVSEMRAMRAELATARIEAARERREMVDRYVAGRETQDKRHAELLLKLQKVVDFCERWFEVLLKGQFKGPIGQAQKILGG